MEAGTRLGPYELLDTLGAGGMGEVWLAQDTRLGRKVAIKVLPEEYARDPERLARFEQEARASAALNHPHIAVVHDVGHEGGVHFMVQELLEGHTLRTVMERGRLPLLEALTLAREIAEALSAAHAVGIVHRDLKPENVFVTGDGHAKVLDFGLAKLTEVAAGPGTSATMSPTVLGTAAGQIMGTAGYMAPEQVEGGEVDQRADLFAFGCLLYEMTAGRRPFDGQNMIDTLNRIANVEPEGLVTIDGALPAELQRILDKCLAKRPAGRYQSAADLIVDLRGLASAVETGRAVSLAEVTGSPARGYPASVVAAAAVVALILGAAASRLLSSPGSTPPPVRRSSVLLDKGLVAAAIWQPIALSPDGSRLAYIVRSGQRTETLGQNMELWVRSLDQIEGVKIADSARNLAVSPDGNWIAFRDADNRLRKVQVSGGAAQTLSEAENVGNARGITWGPDDRIAWARDAGHGGIYEVSAAGGDPKQLTSPAEGEAHMWPYYLPGRAGLLYVAVTTAGYRLMDLDLAAHQSTEIRKGAGQAHYLSTGQLVWAEGGALYAEAFDPGTGETSGQAVPVVEGVLMTDGSGGAAYTVGDDGTLIYMRGVAGEQHSEIRWAADGGEPLVADGQLLAPAVSPDGTRLAYLVQTEQSSTLWVTDLEKSVPTALTFSGTAGHPVWSSDGRDIYFELREDQTSPGAVFRIAADGSSAPEPVANATGFDPDAIARDGSFLVASVHSEETAWDLYVISLAEDSKPQPLAVTPNIEVWAALSPDDHWIAYYSQDPAGAPVSVYVQPWPATGAVRRIPFAGQAGHPRWSADGRTLYFRTNAGVMATPVNASDTSIQFGPPSLVASGFGGIFAGVPTQSGSWYRDYDVAPDGRIMVRASSSSAAEADMGHVMVVEGWADDVARKVAAAQ